MNMFSNKNDKNRNVFIYKDFYEIEILPFSTDKLTKNDKSKSHVRLLLRLESFQQIQGRLDHREVGRQI